MVVTCFAVILCILAGYNTFSTARKNRRDEEERRNKPNQDVVNELREILEKHGTWLANDKARIESLERTVSELLTDTRDMRAGQEALCFGIQTLLDHALHNGNTDEMTQASKELNRYLRSRRVIHDEAE